MNTEVLKVHKLDFEHLVSEIKSLLI
jgi:hypothetical protein